jgi:hypothetical protein
MKDLIISFAICIIWIIGVYSIMRCIWDYIKDRKAETERLNCRNRSIANLIVKLNQLHEDYLATAGQPGRFDQFREDILNEIDHAGWEHYNVINLKYATTKYELEEILAQIIAKLENDIVSVKPINE